MTDGERIISGPKKIIKMLTGLHPDQINTTTDLYVDANEQNTLIKNADKQTVYSKVIKIKGINGKTIVSAVTVRKSCGLYYVAATVLSDD